MVDDVPPQLEDLWQAARAAWPGVEVAAADFEHYLRERATTPTLAGLETNDLYLACACTLATPGAAATFDRVFLVHVDRFVARLGEAGLADEVRQILRERLLLGVDGQPPRIAGYQGQGPLLAWLRVIALRQGLELLRGRAGRAEVELGEQDLADHVGGDLESEIVRTRYRQVFEDSVAAALRGLPRRDRSLLRMHLVGGVSTHKLGNIFHVDQSTIVRWLAAARSKVRETVRARLIEQLQLSPSELDSLAGILLSRLDLSLAGCLRSQDR